MLKHVGRYGRNMHEDLLRQSLLGRAAARKSAGADEDETPVSTETQSKMHEVVERLGAGAVGAAGAGAAHAIDEAIRSFRKDNAMGGRGVFEHLPLPHDLARTMANHFEGLDEQEKQPAFNEVISQLEPSVRTHVAQQVAGVMGRVDQLRTLGAAEWSPDRTRRDGLSRNAASWALSDAIVPVEGGETRSRRHVPPSAANGVGPVEYTREPLGTSKMLSARVEPANTVGSAHPVSLSASDPLKKEKLASERTNATQQDLDVVNLARDLQFFGYDPALLSRNMPGWQTTSLFDNRVPEGYRERDVTSGFIKMNRKGFGAVLARRDRRGTRDHAIMVKGAELSDARFEDILAAASAGAGQVDEAAESVFRECVRQGVFRDVANGGSLLITGHSQGAPSAQLLGIYLITRAIETGLLTEEQALRAIKVRAFGGIGARDFLKHLHEPGTSEKLNIRQAVLEGIDARTYLLKNDVYAANWPGAYVGKVYRVDPPDPASVKSDEFWRHSPGLGGHPRSWYRAADYSKAELDTRDPYDHAGRARTGWGDIYGGLVDVYGDAVDAYYGWRYGR